MMLFGAVVRDRRRAWMWWAVSLVATIVLVVITFSTIEGQTELERTFEDMPESLKVLMGIDDELTLTSAAGYLNSQLFANMLPLLLTIFGIGAAARVLAGEEGEGRLELLLAHPVSRQRVLVERGLAVLALLAALAVVAMLAIVASAPGAGIDDVGTVELLAASTGSLLLGLLHAAITYAVGAWTGRRGVAIAAGSAITAAGFLVQSLANVSEALQPLRWLSPWHWFLDARPIVDGWSSMALPTGLTLAVSALGLALGAWRFQTRDIGSA